MWWIIRTENGGRKSVKAVLLLSGQVDERRRLDSWGKGTMQNIDREE